MYFAQDFANSVKANHDASMIMMCNKDTVQTSLVSHFVIHVYMYVSTNPGNMCFKCNWLRVSNLSASLWESLLSYSLYVTFVCHICMSHLYVTFVCHICMSHLYVTFVCHICMSHLYVEDSY